MKYTETFDHEPAAVELERLPDGTALIRLHKDISIEEVPSSSSDAESSKQWTATAASARLGTDRSTETVESITKDFDSWWIYAENWQEQPPMTLSQRLDAVETVLADMADLMIGGDA